MDDGHAIDSQVWREWGDGETKDINEAGVPEVGKWQ